MRVLPLKCLADQGHHEKKNIKFILETPEELRKKI